MSTMTSHCFEINAIQVMYNFAPSGQYLVDWVSSINYCSYAVPQSEFRISYIVSKLSLYECRYVWIMLNDSIPQVYEI